MPSIHSRSTLLIVDDDELNRHFVSAILDRQDCEILLAENGQEALTILERQPIDIVLLDIKMPVLDGIQTLRLIRERFSLLELPVIMFTAEEEAQRITEVFDLGANDYLAKPIKPAVALARIRTQLAIAQLSRLKDDFLRFASHDLKKPMLVIADILEHIRNLELAEDGAPVRLRDHMQLLEKTNRRMQDVVHGFLDQNHLQSDAQRGGLVDLNEVIQDARDANFAYAQNKQIELLIELSAEVPNLPLDGFKVRQVLDNLIGNAIKFCPRGAQVRVRSRAGKEEVLIEVIDNGPGLTEVDYAKLFQQGVRLSNRPTGQETSSGIGLPMCRQMIEEAGGRIGARPNPQGGAVFWFGFTLKPSQAADDKVNRTG